MSNFIYNPNEYTERNFTPIPEGNHRVRVADVTYKHFSNGKSGFEVKFDVNAYNSKLWYYITDDQYADQKVAEIFWSANKNLPPSIHPQYFPGLVCKVKTRNREYNGEQRAEVHYFIKPATATAPASAAAPEAPKEDRIPF
jgi:hypothetical protein